jgi:RNA processing factor Prp31
MFSLVHWIRLIKQSTLSPEKQEKIRHLLSDDDKTKAVIDAANTSMGTDISEYDMVNVCHFARRVVSLCEYRDKLHHYLSDKVYARFSSCSRCCCTCHLRYWIALPNDSHF